MSTSNERWPKSSLLPPLCVFLHVNLSVPADARTISRSRSRSGSARRGYRSSRYSRSRSRSYSPRGSYRRSHSHSPMSSRRRHMGDRVRSDVYVNTFFCNYSLVLSCPRMLKWWLVHSGSLFENMNERTTFVFGRCSHTKLIEVCDFTIFVVFRLTI